MGRPETSDATDASSESWVEPVAWTPPEAEHQTGSFQDARFDPRRAVARPVTSSPRQGWTPASETQTETVATPKPSVLTRFKQRSQDDETIPDRSNRKPFLMGLLTGVVLTLLLGQIFRATQPAPAYLAPMPSQTSADYGAAIEPEADSDLP